MKKIVIFLLITAIFLFGSFCAVGATTMPKYTVESKSVVEDDVFTLEVAINDNPGIISLRLDIEYDTTVLQLQSVADSELLKGYTQPAEEITSPYRLRWADAYAIVNNESQGAVAKLTFKALTAAKTTVVNIKHVEAFKTTGEATGEKVIFADASANIEVKERVLVTGVTLDKEKLSMKIGEKSTLKATVAPSNAINKTVTWQSNNPSVATVDSKGIVTAIKYGTATITAKTADGGYSDSCVVSVACNHKYNSGVVTKAAKCESTGVKTYTCSVCKGKKTETIKKLGHNYKKIVDEATTKSNGQTYDKCERCKDTKNKKTIYKIKEIELSADEYTYNKKTRKPDVKVEDSKGKKISSSYYKVDYDDGCKNVGKYKVTVKFKGNYSGTKTLYFEILPEESSISKVTAAKKSLKVTVKKKTEQVTGYEIQYSTSKSFKSAKTKTIKSYKTTSLTLSGLSAKKTYYVRVRTYKTVGGKKYYSDWSSAKSKKTK